MDLETLNERLSALEYLFRVVIIDRCLKADAPIEHAQALVDAADRHGPLLLELAESDEQKLRAVGIGVATQMLAEGIMDAVRLGIQRDSEPRLPA